MLKVLFALLMGYCCSWLCAHGFILSGGTHISVDCKPNWDKYIYYEWSEEYQSYQLVVLSELTTDCLEIHHIHETRMARHTRLLHEMDTWFKEKVEKFLACSDEQIENNYICGNTEEDEESDWYPVDWLQTFLREDLVSQGALVVGDCEGTRATGCTMVHYVVDTDDIVAGVTTVDFERIFEVESELGEETNAEAELLATIVHERLHGKWPSKRVDSSTEPPTLVDDEEEHQLVYDNESAVLEALFGEDWKTAIEDQSPVDLHQPERIYILPTWYNL